MSTEQKPANEPKREPNALATGLNNTWTKFKQGKVLSYTQMAVLLLVVAAIGVTWWILHERRNANSAKWREFDSLGSISDFEQYASANPNTLQAKLANLEIARRHLGPEGINLMFAPSPALGPADLETERRLRESRNAAVKNVEKAREEFTKLVDEFKDDPVIRVECMMACAKAEAVLVGIPKEGQLEQRRGDPARAIEWLDKVAEAAPDTPWGKDSKKLADVLRNQNTEEQMATLQLNLFNASPALPGFPTMPAGHP